MAQSDQEILGMLGDLLGEAKDYGATDAAFFYTRSKSTGAGSRMAKEKTHTAKTSSSISFNVYVGQKQAGGSSGVMRPEILREMLHETIDKAKDAPVNPYAGLADPSQIVTSWTVPDIYDPEKPDRKSLFAQAKEAEQAALRTKGITNSEGGSAAWGEETSIILASNGFSGILRGTGSSISVVAIAEENGVKETDNDYRVTVYRADLPKPSTIGDEAAQKTLRKLNSRTMKSGVYPVIFSPEAAASLLREFANAANGMAVALSQSFLGKDDLGKRLFSENVTIIDDPFLPRGHGSRPYDRQGIAARRLVLVEKGELQNLFLGLESGRRLGMESTGHGGQLGSNLSIEPGSVTPADLISDIEEGIYVEELQGHGGNPTSGDYSQGVSGRWIEQGQITFAVGNMTVAGNLRNMFKRIVVANDIDRLRAKTTAPTIRIDGLSLGGL